MADVEWNPILWQLGCFKHSIDPIVWQLACFKHSIDPIVWQHERLKLDHIDPIVYPNYQLGCFTRMTGSNGDCHNPSPFD